MNQKPEEIKEEINKDVSKFDFYFDLWWNKYKTNKTNKTCYEFMGMNQKEYLNLIQKKNFYNK